MAKKEGSEKKPGVKIQDLSPKKDAKGGAGIRSADSLKSQDSFRQQDAMRSQDSMSSSNQSQT
jgi:hypothetical protein